MRFDEYSTKLTTESFVCFRNNFFRYQKSFCQVIIRIITSVHGYYYLVKGFLITKGIIPKTHKGLNSEFSRVFIKTQEIPLIYGEHLAYLFKERQAADYEPEEEIGKEEVDKALQMVEEFINFVKEKYQ